MSLQPTADINPGVDARLDAFPQPLRRHQSLWSRAFRKFSADRPGVVALSVVGVYLLVALGAWAGVWGAEWSDIRGDRLEAPGGEHWLGTNAIGQDIFSRAMVSTGTAFEVGLSVAVASTLLGAILGAISGYFAGSWIDEVILFCKGVLDSIPFYLFVAAVAFALRGNPYAMHVAMIVTFWTTTSRIVRGEVIKLKGQEFVEAAKSVGVGSASIIGRHILPNTSHILLVQGTITFVAAIKSEVILSFLGLGVQDGVSWGVMIAESTQDVQAGHFSNFLTASALLFGLLMAFNLFADALQDALDPKKVN